MPITIEQLLDAAVSRNLVEMEVLVRLRADARRLRADLMELVTAHHRIPASALYQAYAEARGLPFTDPVLATPPEHLLKKLPHSLMQRKLVLPLEEIDNTVLLAVACADDRATLDSVQRMLGRQIKIALAEPGALLVSINRALLQFGAPRAMADVDVVAQLDEIFREAFLRRASDIHLMPEESGLRVRLRVDGRLQDYLPRSEGGEVAALVSRVKVLSNLDIAEQREAQDGGFSYRLPPPIDREFNVRVATAPTRLGERVTMRLLGGQESTAITLPDLGMAEEDLRLFRQAIRKPFGMILLTGPTGSGKSTTLFAALQEIANPEINIMTVENPIEYFMEGVSQVQTGHKITFAEALRSFLRHDPDVLMVGEIRDEETADVALKAAMTGHLVFSTLHTNTACGTVVRLADIGCEAYLIGSTMNAVIAQRLVRRLCHHCRLARVPTAEEQEKLKIASSVVLYDPKGCAACQGKGYRGRLGLYETLWFDSDLSRFVSRGCDEEALESYAGSRLRYMWQDGRDKVLRGMTTFDELCEVAVFKEAKE